MNALVLWGRVFSTEYFKSSESVVDTSVVFEASHDGSIATHIINKDDPVIPLSISLALRIAGMHSGERVQRKKFFFLR